MNYVTKEDLQKFQSSLLTSIKNLIEQKFDDKKCEAKWLRSKAVRKIMEISPATLQNLRISGKIKYTKILGSYYYCKSDLDLLFKSDDDE